jgi:hypothetical protein
MALFNIPKFPNFNTKASPEAELQKKIIETEKEYKSGLNTLRDLIAPSAFQINANNVQISGKLARTFFVLSYPRYISVNWLAPIISLDSAMDMSMFIYPMDTVEIMKKLRNKVGQLESSMSMNAEKGNVRDPMLARQAAAGHGALLPVFALLYPLRRQPKRFGHGIIYPGIFAWIQTHNRQAFNASDGAGI